MRPTEQTRKCFFGFAQVMMYFHSQFFFISSSLERITLSNNEIKRNYSVTKAAAAISASPDQSDNLLESNI